MTKRSFVILGMALVVMAGVGNVEAQSVWMDPATLVLPGIGTTADLTVRANGFDQLFGIELYIVFPGDIVIATGDPVAGVCPPPDFPVHIDHTNDWDAVTPGNQGLARYVVSGLFSPACDTTPAGAFFDAVVTTVNFQRVGPGTAAIAFNLTSGDVPAGEPSISIAVNNTTQTCDDSTLNCWTAATTDIPVELMSFSIE